MRIRQRSSPIQLVLVVLLLAVSTSAFGQRARSKQLSESARKISPYLADEIGFLRDNPEYDYRIPVIVRLAQSAKMSGTLVGRGRTLTSIRSYSTFLRSGEIARLLESGDVERISIDSVVSASRIDRSAKRWANPDLPSNDYLATIGAQSISRASLDGDGMTVAVFDSGIYGHPDLDYGNKIVFSVDFTSGEAVVTDRNQDGYGHGTHVAGLIAGDGRSSGGLYRGVAPRASLIDVKVLGDDGMGRVSNLIAAIEWVTEYRRELDVRVANFSVSTPAFEPFYQDPLCEAVKSMTRAGITVVASSGNLGRLEGYPEIWGGVTSPGTSPYVITVYPLNHKGTADRTDDVATTYGSRGPSFGTRLWKPDLAAPGNRITSLVSPESFLAAERSDSRIGDEYLELSGSSMAVPLVSGSALLLLQAEPRLSPLGIKRALLATVTDDAQAHPLEQGRGTLNVQLALELTARFSEARSESAADVLIRKPVRSLETNASRLTGFPTKSMTDGAIWADDRWGAMWADDRWGAMWE
jgi:serine protease AprX